jgi:hypothetical protein
LNRDLVGVFRDPRRAGRWLLRLGLVLVVAGYFGPWMPHETVALTVTGFELAEFAKFFPQVQGGTVPLTRALFYLPLVTALILSAFLVGRSTIRLARLIGPPFLAILLVGALLPYSVVDAVRQALIVRSPLVLAPQYVWQTALVILGVILALLSPLARRLSRRASGILVAVLALAGAVPPLWQFALLRPLVVALYDEPLGLGWGLIACMAGFVLLLLSGSTSVPSRPKRVSASISERKEE